MRTALTVGVTLFPVCAGLAGYFARSFDWQKLDPKIGCQHCLSVHSKLGSIALIADVVTLSSLLYAASLPYAVALEGQPYTLARIGVVLILFSAVLTTLWIGGGIIRVVSPPKPLVFGANINPISCFLTGIRTCAVLLAAYLLSGGPSIDSVAAKCESIFGFELASRLSNLIEPGTVRNTALVISASSLFSFGLRWLGPSLLGSRPLALGVLPNSVKHRGALA